MWGGALGFRRLLRCELIWTKQTSPASRYMTGGSTGSGSGFLNAFKKMNIYTGDDNVSTTTWYRTPVEHELCAAVDLMFYFDAVVWLNNSIEYGPKLGPNRNTFARWLGERTG